MFWGKTLKLAGLTSLMIFSTAQAATFDKPETDIEYRQSAFTMIAINFSDMADMVKGKKDWNDALLQRRAEQLVQLIPMAQHGFIASDSQTGDTKAKAAIWTDADGFAAKFSQFSQDAQHLATVAKAGDRGQIKTAFAQTAKNCKSCHNDYKEK